MGGGGVSSSGGDQRRGGENWRGGGDYAKSSCSAEVNIRSESNEPSLSRINIECPKKDAKKVKSYYCGRVIKY